MGVIALHALHICGSFYYLLHRHCSIELDGLRTEIITFFLYQLEIKSEEAKEMHEFIVKRVKFEEQKAKISYL